jgi:hypothetical protein
VLQMIMADMVYVHSGLNSPGTSSLQVPDHGGANKGGNKGSMMRNAAWTWPVRLFLDKARPELTLPYPALVQPWSSPN